ncbi:MAG TPA: TIGR03089 family protein [Micromonosporaceae bacterium]
MEPAPVPPTVLAALAAGDPTRPVITYYDDRTGERTELSRATLGNWVAKTANLLADGFGLGPGEIAAVRLPAHWQTAAVLLGCWSAGLVVDLGPHGDGPDRAAIGFVSAETAGQVTADDVLALALAPLAAPFRPGPPPGTQDYVVEVRGHGDHFTARHPVRGQTPALADGTRHVDLVAAAAVLALPAGERIMIDADQHADPVHWLVAPLLAGCPVVLCGNLDPARVAARLSSERAVWFPPGTEPGAEPGTQPGAEGADSSAPPDPASPV